MHNGTLVLIDDNKVEAMLCKEAFKDADIKNPIMMFYDGESAFDYISKNAQSIFMIVCDISMPRMTGIELLSKINHTPELDLLCIPFIFLTNSDAPKDVKDAYSLTTHGYFQKPMDLSGLGEMFKSIISYWKLSLTPKNNLRDGIN